MYNIFIRIIFTFSHANTNAKRNDAYIIYAINSNTNKVQRERYRSP